MSLKNTLIDISGTHKNATEAVDKAILKVKLALSKEKFSPPKNQEYDEWKRDLLYVIHETSIANTYILVNRNYKPLGSTSVSQVKYEDFYNLHIQLTPDQLSTVVCPPHDYGLFGDSTAPWRNQKNAKDYLEKMILLRTLIQG